MRSLTSGIDAALTAEGQYPGWLVEITLTTGQVVRRTSFDTVFTFDGEQWIPVDIEMPSLSWDGGVLRPGRIIFGDADLTFWALTGNLALADARVRMWQAYADVADEAEPVWSGRVSEVVRRNRDLAIEITLSNDSDTQTAPRYRVQQLIPSVYLMPGGTKISIGGETWVIDRPRTAAS